MTESSKIHLLDTPLSSPPLLDLLTNHLPHSLPVLRRLQYAANFPSNGLGTTPYSHVLYASRYSVEECLEGPKKQQQEGKKDTKGRKHFAAAFVDLSRFPETQVWVYSTLEDYGVFDPEMVGSGAGTAGTDVATAEMFSSQSHSLPEEEAKECDQLLLALLRRMRTIAVQMPVELDPGFCSEERRGNWCEAREYFCMSSASAAAAAAAAAGNEGPKVMIGSLAEIHRHRLFLDDKNKNNQHGYGVKMHKTANIPDEIEWEVCQKWLFRTEALGSSPEKKEGQLEKMMQEEGLVWDRVRTKEDVKLVLSRTSIKRQEDTLLGLPSVAVRESKEGGTMVAWGFMAFDGTLMTLHVEEQYRGKGLAKAVACKVMRDHVKDYGDDGWGAADVFVENHRSQGVCRSIGGRVGWLLSWAVVDLATVGDAL